MIESSSLGCHGARAIIALGWCYFSCCRSLCYCPCV